jgi:hypothetical protein
MFWTMIAGALVMVISEIGMRLQVEPFWSWHTPIAWTGYIVFVDAWVYRRRGNSWLSRSRAEFAFLAAVSIPLWLVFEWFNLFIRNWHYINLPEHMALRYFGYAWSFATIWPAIFETSELVETFRRRPKAPNPRPAASVPTPSAFGLRPSALFLLGAALLLWPILWPSPYLAAPVWLGFIFLLDPLNDRLGGESLLRDLRQGSVRRAVNLAVAGLICGVLWEFWNYWARTKWIYDVPILPELKIFEMPVPGYGGFPAFALECFTMYVSVRLIFWRGARRAISL